MDKAQALLERIQALPPERIAEVEDFVDFIAQKDRRRAALERLLVVAPALENAAAEPISDAAILDDIDAMRARRSVR